MLMELNEAASVVQPTADNLTTFMCQLSRNVGATTSWNPPEPVQACNVIALPLPV
jgi:phage baseplate assembly protein gpV